jgi:hypothetical protein
MFRRAFRSILAHKARFLLPTLGMVLGVAFVVGSLLYGDSVEASVDRAQARAQADVAVEVTPYLLTTPLGDDIVQRLRTSRASPRSDRSPTGTPSSWARTHRSSESATTPAATR